MIKNPTKVAPLFKGTFDADKFDNTIHTCNDRKKDKQDKIKKLQKQLFEYQKQIAEQVEQEHAEIAFLTRTKYACKRIININNKLDISNTFLDKLPTDIFRKIQMKNLCDEIKSFITNNRKFQYRLGIEYNYTFRKMESFTPPIKLTHNNYRRCILIHGNEYVYGKGVLMNYLEQNGIKGYKSWTFKKLYDKCYSF